MSTDRLIPANEALDIVLRDAQPTQRRLSLLEDAAGFVLAEDIVARRTQPPFDASAMDGFAVRATDVEAAPVDLTIVGESRAGVPFNAAVNSGEAVRIFTGAVVPEGTDTIVIQENTRFSEQTVEVLEPSAAGKYVRKAGLDFKEGKMLLHKGELLTPARLALAASMDHSKLPVYQRPKVAVIATGDELVLPGTPRNDGQIIASNTFGIRAMVSSAGGEVVDMGIVADRKHDLGQAFETAIAQGADIILTTGGASVGDHDLVMPVAKTLGFHFEIAKIAVRPGKPFLFAKKQTEARTVYLVGLAGNPVSSLVAFSAFAKPLIGKLKGLSDTQTKPVAAVLGCDLGPNDERMEYMRAELAFSKDGTRIATPFKKQDSSMLATLVRAQCLVIRPANAKASPKGEACEIILLD